MPIAELQDKARGILVGGAIGDALGRSVERMNPGSYWIEKYEKWKGWESGAIGTITDDTQMTIWLAELLIENKGLNPEHVAKSFTSHRIRGIGTATREFVSNFKDRNLSWFESGINSSGNGVAMRSSPIGIYFRNNFENLKLAGGIHAIITHNDPMAIASGIVVSVAISLLLSMRSLQLTSLEEKIEFCNLLAASIEDIESKFPYLTRNTKLNSTLFTRIKIEIPEFLSRNINPKDVNEIFWSGAYVLESLPFALYCFLFSTNDFRSTLLNSVNYSRDSDTVGSLACSFSGALNGMNEIDKYYIENLEFKDYLIKLADKLLIKE